MLVAGVWTVPIEEGKLVIWDSQVASPIAQRTFPSGDSPLGIVHSPIGTPFWGIHYRVRTPHWGVCIAQWESTLGRLHSRVPVVLWGSIPPNHYHMWDVCLWESSHMWEDFPCIRSVAKLGKTSHKRKSSHTSDQTIYTLGF